MIHTGSRNHVIQLPACADAIQANERSTAVTHVPTTSTVARASSSLEVEVEVEVEVDVDAVSGRATEIVLAARLKAAVAIVPKVSLVCTSQTCSVSSDLPSLVGIREERGEGRR